MRWLQSIQASQSLVAGEGQANLVVIVSGSVRDTEYWVQSVESVSSDILSADRGIRIVGAAEEIPAGNFLGTIAAWNSVDRQNVPLPSNGISLMCMVFGQGTRLSPFTQALGNRKAALPTPFRGRRTQQHLRTIDLAILYSSLWMNRLRENGFSGVLVKWGDEATLPGVDWPAQSKRFSSRDMVRFVWKTEPTEMYAREKEWFIIDNQSDSVVGLIPRQPLESLKAVMSKYEGNRYSLAVNLGSLAVSYQLMEHMRGVFENFAGNSSYAADWDPVVSYLLLSDGADENEHSRAAISRAETRFPGIVPAIRRLNESWRLEHGTPLSTGYLDFGSALWVDLGLHESLRKCLDALHEDSELGAAMRAFFDVNSPPDADGNRLIRSNVHPAARIRNSIVIDSSILSADSVIEKSLVVGCHARTLHMPTGGACLFSRGNILEFAGPGAIAFRVAADSGVLKAGERRTTIQRPGERLDVSSFETVQKYDASIMDVPVFENRISFTDAGLVTAAMHPSELEAVWNQMLTPYGSGL
jgi:hypothetical protein